MSTRETDKRQDVFLCLVSRDEVLTPSEIGEEIGESRQTVKYHLDKLVEGGLVYHEAGGYRCQPVFTDEALEEQFVDMLANLVPAVSDRIVLEDGVAPESEATAVFNCIRMFMALEVLEPADEQAA